MEICSAVDPASAASQFGQDSAADATSVEHQGQIFMAAAPLLRELRPAAGAAWLGRLAAAVVWVATGAAATGDAAAADGDAADGSDVATSLALLSGWAWVSSPVADRVSEPGNCVSRTMNSPPSQTSTAPGTSGPPNALPRGSGRSNRPTSPIPTAIGLRVLRGFWDTIAAAIGTASNNAAPTNIHSTTPPLMP